MKKIALLMAAVFGLCTVVSADNLVKNGEFEKLDKKGVPVNWNIGCGKGTTFKAVTSGAPDGGSVTFTVPKGSSFTLRQIMTEVVKPNTKYEVSFKIRGKDFSALTLGMIFINEGWTKSSGLKNLKATAEWKEHKAVFATPDFKKIAALTFYANKAQGVVEIADVEVEALDND